MDVSISPLPDPLFYMESTQTGHIALFTKRTGQFDIFHIENVVLCVCYAFITKKFKKKTFFIVLCVLQIEQCTYLFLFDSLYLAVFAHLLIE